MTDRGNTNGGMLAGKAAVITGSTAGIGYAVADRLASDGCNIVLNGVEAVDDIAPKAKALVSRHGVKVYYDKTDVGDTAAVEAMMATAADRFGNVDIVVNNAVTRYFGAIEDTAPADWNRAMAVNLDSAFNTIRCAMPGMKKRGWGRIVNMSSIYGMIGSPNRVSYVVAKTALLGLTRAIALEVLDHEITVNAVCPGSVNTTHSSRVIETAIAEDGLSEQEAVRRFLAGKQPSGRFIAPESVAALVGFLCSPAGKDINGAVMPVDMAWSAS